MSDILAITPGVVKDAREGSCNAAMERKHKCAQLARPGAARASPCVAISFPF